MSDPKRYNDPEHLNRQQYHNANKLSVRIRLHQDYGTKGTDSLHRDYFDAVLASVSETARVLELGTGRGDLWAKNADRIPSDWHIILSDISQGMLDDNQIHLGALANRMQYRVVNAMDIPYPDNHFDVLFANHMLYHVPDIPKAIHEIQRVLKPSGIFFASTNGDSHMAMLYKLAQQIDEISEWESEYHDTFTLQNGVARLMPYFYDIRMIRIDNNLWVTDTQPLLDYIQSIVSIDGEALINAQEQTIRAEIDQMIADEGGVFIQKEFGFFIACDLKKQA